MESVHGPLASDEKKVQSEGIACEMDVDAELKNPSDESPGDNLRSDQESAQAEANRAWWLDTDSASVAASYKASQAQFAKLKDSSQALIELNDSEDEESLQSLELHHQKTIQNLCKLRTGLTAQAERDIWAKLFGVSSESVIHLSEPLITNSSAKAQPPCRPIACRSSKPSLRSVRVSTIRKMSSSPFEGENSVSREQSPAYPTDTIKYPRLSRPIVLSDDQIRRMLQRIDNAPRPANADYQLSHNFQKIIRHGKFFENSHLNDALGHYLSSFGSLADAFKQSMSIFWDSQTLQSHTIPSKIDSLDLKPDQVLPIIPLQHEFWTYWNAITDEKNMSAGQRHSLMTIVGLVNSKHNKACAPSGSSSRRLRPSIPEGSYYDYECPEDSSGHSNNINRVSSSHARSPRLPSNAAQTSTRDCFVESMRSSLIAQRPSPHRSVSSGSSNRPSGALPDRRTSYTNSSPQQQQHQQQQAANNHKFASYSFANGSSPNTSDISNHGSMSNSHKASRSASSSKGVGREVGRAFDSLFADRIEDMLSTCSTLFKPMSAQPKAETWLPPDAIERMNNLQFFSDMGLNISIGVIILSQATIGAAVRAVALVFWGQSALFSQKVMKPASKFNMSPANPSGLPGETAFHSLWNCILQFERDDTIYERYLRAVNYIAESMRKEQHVSVRSYPDY